MYPSQPQTTSGATGTLAAATSPGSGADANGAGSGVSASTAGSAGERAITETAAAAARDRLDRQAVEVAKAEDSERAAALVDVCSPPSAALSSSPTPRRTSASGLTEYCQPNTAITASSATPRTGRCPVAENAAVRAVPTARAAIAARRTTTRGTPVCWSAPLPPENGVRSVRASVS
ncbi:hypothetical protein BRC69_05325 [Halobacteriales archaeon QH_6_66_25]|nr:MAG: hypothetical protein BRC69_05325 [Halobacteriales archaeon QH_6_66_25]